jgi:hypothetical protein
MSVGFKELASVCAAIDSGKQALLLRKAGLRESTAESGFKASSFFLLPTHYHDKEKGSPGVGFDVALRVEVIRAGDLRDWSIIEKLAPLTAYDPKTLREHFDSRDEKLLHFALVKAFRLQPIWHLPSAPELSGCRSWFELPAPPVDTKESPVKAEAVLKATQALLS